MTIDDWTTRDHTTRVPLTVTATRAPGRHQPWRAEAGAWNASEKTEKAAVTAIASDVAAFLALYREPIVVTYAGYTAVVSLSRHTTAESPSWHTLIIRPDGTNYVSGRSADSWDMAKAAARLSLAHDATDWHDNASVHAGAAFLAGGERFAWGQYGPTEFLDYAAWQRAAQHAMDAGMACWHEWAGAHAREFAVPPADAA